MAFGLVKQLQKTKVESFESFLCIHLSSCTFEKLLEKTDVLPLVLTSTKMLFLSYKNETVTSRKQYQAKRHGPEDFPSVPPNKSSFIHT